VRIRSLNLKREVTPENAPAFAQDAVASAARITGVALDYSVASLEAVDRIIEDIRASGGNIDTYAETMFCFGCYVGEVFVRRARGRWIATPEDQLKVFGMRLIVELPPRGQLCNPIAKAFKRLHNGKVSIVVPRKGTSPDADSGAGPDHGGK
jgi:hypothetical protein